MIFRTAIVLGSITFWFPSFLFAQKLHIAELGPEQGVVQSAILGLAQDKHGFIWFGSDGLHRYDGSEIKVYRADESDSITVSNNAFFCPLVTKKGDLIAGSLRGLVRFDERLEKIEFLERVRTPWNFERTISAIIEDHEGFLWVSYFGAGIARFDTGYRLVAFYQHENGSDRGIPNNYVETFVPLASHRLALGTPTGAWLFDYDGGSSTRISLGMPAASTGRITSLLSAGNGDLWIATEYEGLFRIREGLKPVRYFLEFSRNKIKPENGFVRALCEDKQGRIWVGSWNGTLVRLNPVTATVDHLPPSAAAKFNLDNGGILSLFIDRSENLWIGTHLRGVFRFDLKPQKFSVAGNRGTPLAKYFQPYVWRIARAARDRVWVVAGTTFQLDRSSGTVLQQDNFASNPTTTQQDVVLDLISDSLGNAWVSKRSGVEKRSPNGILLQRYPVSPREDGGYLPSSATALKLDSRGILWLGFQNGSFARLEPGSHTLRTVFKEKPENLKGVNAQVNQIVEDQNGDLWFGRSFGLIRYSRSTNSIELTQTHSADARSLSSNEIFSLCVAQSGFLWVGTALGLNKFDPKTGNARRFHVKDGLANDKVWAVLEDGRGRIWLSTNRGISSVEESEEGTVRICNYDLADGLPGLEFNLGAAFKDPTTGEMFFGSMDGVVYFHPDSVLENPYPPRVTLTGFRKFDQEAWLGQSPVATQAIKLSYSENVFSLRFAALEFTRPENNQFAYKMEGFEEDWVYAGKRREVRYTNLDPGEYTFRVKAANNDGLWSEEAIAAKITIEPPYWRTWWFLTVCIAALIATLGGTVRFVELRKIRRRIEQLERAEALERERVRISRDMHDEVGSSLTQIAILSELAKRQSSLRKTKDHLGKISQTAREVIDSMSEIIWAINPKNDQLENLAAYLREYASEFLEGTAIRPHFDFPEQLQDLHISAAFRRNLFLAVKETLNNTAKHSHATMLRIVLVLSPNKLSIRITDNGKGFDPKRVLQRSNGLRNLQKRLEEIGGSFSIQSAPGKGTEISFEIDL
jgi:signal transduction histidine kinase/ligand-binding sensor domain-containing protein